MQIPARGPATTAMTAASLDLLSGGRFVLGLGVSGPQVSEGWHGVPFAHPVGRTREYIEIVNQVLRRERLTHAGRHFSLPLPDGPGKSLALAMTPLRPHVPIYVAAVGEQTLGLAGEVADGWLSAFFSPYRSADALRPLKLDQRPADRPFAVVANVPMFVGDDLEACADAIRPHAALYIGGMGSREKNFYYQLAAAMGYEEAASRVQDAYLSGDRAAAAAAVPFGFIDETSLIGPVDRIGHRMKDFAAADVTTLTITLSAVPSAQREEVVRAAAAAFAAAGVG
jgi:F420-dependent oxidoreductase-like protein